MIYKTLFRPLLFRLDAETAHHFSMKGLEAACRSPFRSFLESFFGYDDLSLSTKVFDIQFPNPVGLAAGFDKNAEHLASLALLGFGFLETGTVTLEPQPGNPKPRVKRVPEKKAIWNHLGFNNKGAKKMKERLIKLNLSIPIGINIGKSRIVPIEKAVADYLSSFEILFPHSGYFVLNISSPNTPDLRQLQGKERLTVLLEEIQKKNEELSVALQVEKKPILIKISPDLAFEAIDDILETALQFDIAGIIATNTTLSREGSLSGLPDDGGISGLPLRKHSTEIIRYLYRRLRGKIAIVGVGGIFSAEDAFEKIAAGASLVQIYTGLIYEGPVIVREIKQGLASRLKQERMTSVAQAVGTKAD